MSEATSQTLLRAYELIEADRQDEARDLLTPVLEAEPENADALWLYAHAVDTPEDALNTMSRLMEIDPDYPGVAELNSKVRNQLGMAPDDDFYDEFEAADASQSGRPWFRIVAAALIAVLVLVVIFVLASGSDDTGSATREPTQVADSQTVSTVNPTSTDVSDETPVATEVVTTEVSVSITEEVSPEVGMNDMIRTAFVDFNLADDPIEAVGSAEVGKALLVGICAGEAPLELIDQSMQIMASLAPQITSYDAVGIRVIDCESSNVINSIVVERSIADDFQNGDISFEQFQSLWRGMG